MFGGLANSWLKACLGWLPAFVREALALTFASSVLATPFSAALFSQLPLAAPVANIAIAPLFGPVCAAGIIGAVVCAMLPLPGVVASITCACASLLLKVVQACASIPYASIPIVAPAFFALLAGFVSACVLWLWWPKPVPFGLSVVVGDRNRRAVVFALLNAPIPYGGCEIVALDVGQGDAILIRSGGHSVLVDTGNQDALLRQALARHHITRLDALIVTHPDDDHMGSLASLDGVVQVDRVLLARDGLTCSCASCAKLRGQAVSLVGKERSRACRKEISFGSAFSNSPASGRLCFEMKGVIAIACALPSTPISMGTAGAGNGEACWWEMLSMRKCRKCSPPA